MNILKVTFWQIIGFFKGFLTAVMIPITVVLWFFGAIGVLLCAGLDSEKDDEINLIANVIERGWNTIIGKNKKKS